MNSFQKMLELKAGLKPVVALSRLMYIVHEDNFDKFLPIRKKLYKKLVPLGLPIFIFIFVWSICLKMLV